MSPPTLQLSATFQTVTQLRLRSVQMFQNISSLMLFIILSQHTIYLLENNIYSKQYLSGIICTVIIITSTVMTEFLKDIQLSLFLIL